MRAARRALEEAWENKFANSTGNYPLTGGRLHRAWQAGVSLLGRRERHDRQEVMPVVVPSDPGEWPGDSLVTGRPYLPQSRPVALDADSGQRLKDTEQLEEDPTEAQDFRVTTIR